MTDHEHFEELAALSAAGLLSEQEVTELRDHSQACPQCRDAEKDYCEIFRLGLPLTAGSVGEFLRQRKVRTDSGSRYRFLALARREGVAFSPEVRETAWQRPKLGILAGAAAAVAVLVAVVFWGPQMHWRGIGGRQSGAQETIAHLEQENAALNESISQLKQSAAAQQNEIEKLQAKLGVAAKTAESLREQNAQERTEVQGASSQAVQFPAELANRDRQLDEARSEIQRISELKGEDEASLVAQQVRIAELSDQLRVASATLDMERKLTAAGKDIRELLTARQLHVIDVRDIQANGKPGKAFGRIFLTEGKSLTFYAFDLNETHATDAKLRYEVWGTRAEKGSPPQRLGLFYVDDKSQRRWALNVNDPQVIKDIRAVFVTAAAPGSSATPSGQPLLYANLGQANHP